MSPMLAICRFHPFAHKDESPQPAISDKQFSILPVTCVAVDISFVPRALPAREHGEAEHCQDIAETSPG